MTPTLPQPPFEIPPATRDENAPRGGPIRVTGFKPSGRDYSHHPARSVAEERASRENLAAHNHRMGYDVDPNILPVDKLFW